MRTLIHRQEYLDRMAKPLQEKLKVSKYIPEEVKNVLDVGCADGAVTRALAELFPQVNFYGIDLDEGFIRLASETNKDLDNVKFEKIYLRDLLARPERFDAVTFCSVLHEFYTYGEGISSVLKALADAHELLNENGVIIIRDMILGGYTKKANLHYQEILEKILNSSFTSHVEDFENRFGKLNNLYKINHFLLKYFYTDNWNREGKEHYVPVTFEEYEQIFNLLGMTVQCKVSYLLPFLKEKWMADFNFSEDEAALFSSTGILVAQKNKIIHH